MVTEGDLEIWYAQHAVVTLSAIVAPVLMS